MFYTVYKITNNIDGKFYIGSHRTNDVNDSYMGSGKYIKRAIEKYGIDNFSKEVLFVFDNADDMFAKEAEIVNLQFLSEENVYNLKVGGFGGWDHENLNSEKQKAKNIKGNAKIKWLLENDKDFLEKKQKVGSNNFKNAHKMGKIKYDTFSGKPHSDETKQKIGKANAKRQSGSGNSQFGTMWITNGVDSKKINKVDTIPDGWYRGRKLP